jgi:hypothetical protein
VKDYTAYIRNAASNRQMQHIDKELDHCHKELRTLLQTDEDPPITLKDQEFPLHISAEECSADVLRLYGQSALMPTVRVYSDYAILKFIETRAEYRCEGAVNRAVLDNRSILWNVSYNPPADDLPTSVTLSGYTNRRTPMWKNGGFVDDPRFPRNCSFMRCFNKIQ